MAPRKIDVIFHINAQGNDFGRDFPISRITPAQLNALMETIANAKRPADACPTNISVKYEDRRSFLNGGMCTNSLSERRRILEISDLFWTSNGNIRCHDCTHKDELAMMRRCAHNLRAGKCRDAFMRDTFGRVLFPRVYAKDNQK